jgi:centromere protein J
VGHDGKIQRIYQSGKKEVIFTNGVRRETHPDGYMIVYFANEDIKQTFPDQKVVYYFAEAKTTQTTFSDGLQVFKFAN